jgi:hypothetical protein
MTADPVTPLFSVYYHSLAENADQYCCDGFVVPSECFAARLLFDFMPSFLAFSLETKTHDGGPADT